MNKEQFFRICHISKSTALHLLKSGKVPCEWSGKKTRCYKIRKEDVKAYLEERAIFPELYSAPKGWYGAPTMWRGSPRSCRRTHCRKLYTGNEQAGVDDLRLFCVQKRTMLF